MARARRANKLYNREASGRSSLASPARLPGTRRCKSRSGKADALRPRRHRGVDRHTARENPDALALCIMPGNARATLRMCREPSYLIAAKLWRELGRESAELVPLNL